MATRPLPLLALASALTCLASLAMGQAFANDSPLEHSYANAPVQLGHANQGASLATQPARSRLPPVTLAQYEEPISADPEASPKASEQADSVPPLNPLATPLGSPAPLQLSRPQPNSAGDDATAKAFDANSTMLTVGTSLAAVLGLFFLMAYMFRRNLPRSVQAPPGEVLEVLGRAPLPGKQQLQVVRFGSKLVLLSVTPEGVETVSEITDPDEVQQLTALCRRESPGSSAHAFHEILAQMGREPAKGFLDQRSASPQLSRR